MREKRKMSRLTPVSLTENFRRCQKNKNTKKCGAPVWVTIVFPIVKL